MLRLLAVTLICIAGLSSQLEAKTFMATIYSDGYSCPANCDAHVVFKAINNGTRYAYLPSSSRSAPQPCVPGAECRICFSDSDNSCMNAMFRKSGPDDGRFDFTPAFYQANCGKPGLPTAFASVCNSFGSQYAKYTKNQVYCLEQPTYAGCGDVIAKAQAARVTDEPLWQECRSLGEDKFNAKYAAKPRLQRTFECAYELHGTGGPNSKGQHWKRLLPAACWPGTYVGRNGTDCCDERQMSLGGLGKECTPFLVKK